MRRLLRFVVAWCALLLLKSPVRESHMFIPSGYNSFAFRPIRSQVQLKPASQQASPGIGRSSIAGSRTRLFFCAANLFLKPNIVERIQIVLANEYVCKSAVISSEHSSK